MRTETEVARLALTSGLGANANTRRARWVHRARRLAATLAEEADRLERAPDAITALDAIILGGATSGVTTIDSHAAAFADLERLSSEHNTLMMFGADYSRTRTSK